MAIIATILSPEGGDAASGDQYSGRLCRRRRQALTGTYPGQGKPAVVKLRKPATAPSLSRRS